MLKNIFNTAHSQLTDWGLLVLRISIGVLMITHGLPKLTNFNQIVSDGQFIPILGSVALGLALTVMAEFFMSLFLIAGLFTRLSIVPLIITMLVAVFVAHANDPFAVKEHALLFLFPFLTLLLAGPGRFSVDYFLAKKIKK